MVKRGREEGEGRGRIKGGRGWRKVGEINVGRGERRGREGGDDMEAPCGEALE